MKERLPIAISIAALVVAVFGSTGLGEAAQNGVTAGVSKAKRATGVGAQESSARRGPRGYRGYRGYRGLRGFQGPPGDKGDKGDKGDTGPSTDAFELVSSAPITVIGTTFETAATVLTMPLAAGKFVVTAQATIEGTADGTAVCRARAPGAVGPGSSSTARFRIGIAAGSTRAATLTMVFGVSATDAGAVHLRCWEENGTGTDPTATASSIVAVKIGALTQSGS